MNEPIHFLSTNRFQKCVCFCAGLFAVASIFAAEVRPVDPSTPVFRIYLAFKAENQQPTRPGPQVTFDSKRPLLVVWSARNVQLTQGGKGVAFALTDKDTKTFAAFSRKYVHGLLLVEGQGSVLTAMQITEPLDTGILEFKEPDDAVVTKYLRRRFKLGESR
jgi:hypothetical protein